LLEQLDHIQRFEEARSLAGLQSPLGNLAKTLLGIAPGVNSLHGWHELVGAFRDKIHDPAKFSNVLGFATGGSFIVPGQGSGDIFPIAPNVRAAAGETVTVTTHGMDQKLGALIEVQQRQVQELARQTQIIERLERSNAALVTELGAIKTLYGFETNRIRHQTPGPVA
jgi:hypothetical protein